MLNSCLCTILEQQIISVMSLEMFWSSIMATHLISRQNLKWRKKLFFHLLELSILNMWLCLPLNCWECMMGDLVSMEHLWNNMDRGKLKCLEENLHMSLFHHKTHMDSLRSNLGLCGGRPVSAWPMAWPSPLLGRNYNICILDLKVTDVIQEAERMPQTQTTPWRRHTPSIRQETRFDIWQNEYWASECKRISRWELCRKQRCEDKFQMPSLQRGVTY